MSDSPPLPVEALPRHTLPDEDFAALAAGRPPPRTLDQLKRSQVSRHLLLLREIDRLAPGSAYPNLAAAQRDHPQAVRHRLSDPLFGAWATSCLKALRAGSTPAQAGVPHLKTLIPPTEPRPTGTPDTGRRLQAGHDGLTIDVRLEDTDPLRALLGLTPAPPLTDAEAAHWQELFSAAWHLLVTRHRAEAEVLATVLRVIVPVEADPAARGISATSADAYGAVAISLPADPATLAVGLLHETRHSLLNAVTYLFDLHTDPSRLTYSPWRDDPRPASGVLHGAYAYLAVTNFWRTEAATGNRLATFEYTRWREAVIAATDHLLTATSLTPAGHRFVQAIHDEAAGWPPPTAQPTKPGPARSGRLPSGDQAAQTAEIVRLAKAANTDHYLRWRLRNLRVDPADARTLAEAWTNDQEPPEQAMRSQLVPAPRRALENSARLDLIHATLKADPPNDPTPTTPTDPASRPDAGDGGGGGGSAGGWGGGGDSAGGRVSGADVAFVGGLGGTVAPAYEKLILEDAEGGGDDAAWSGLALVLGWVRVEVVAAVYRARPQPFASPTALGRWIEGGS